VNTALGRLLIIRRDAARAAGSLTDYHTCLSKIEARITSLRDKGIGDVNTNIAAMQAEEALNQAKRLMGQVLGELDKATSVIDNVVREARKRIMRKRAEERGEAQRLAITRRIN
jgi:hypothetical protein